MKKASLFSLVLIISLFIISTPSVSAAPTCPAGYFEQGEFCCYDDINFEKPGNAGGRKFCQPQITGCQSIGRQFCSAGSKNSCCQAGDTCGLGTAFLLFEVAVCVPPQVSACDSKFPGYIGKTKDDKNVCCQNNQEPSPITVGTNYPVCQPKTAQTCAVGEQFTQGTGAYRNEKRCCPAGTNPSLHLNGMPFCAFSSAGDSIATEPLGVIQNGDFCVAGSKVEKVGADALAKNIFAKKSRKTTLEMENSNGRFVWATDLSQTLMGKIYLPILIRI